MPISINGSGSITGLSAGGLPDGSIQLADLATTGTASGSTFLRGDGAFAEAGGGKILKAEYGTNNTQYATTSVYPQDAFTFTFTPTSATSTVVIHMTVPIALNIASGIQLVGNFAVCKNDNTVLNAQQYSQQHDYMNRHSSGHAPTCQDTIIMVAKDTPGSTSQQTYKIRYGQQTSYNHRVAIRDHEGPGGAGKDNSFWTIFEFE
jgi:alpha-acetolactate decarboxylase|tara:strand:+ start:20 stop:634 length:615 start_codon:yes stop_codon:yes gene_type:complete